MGSNNRRLRYVVECWSVGVLYMCSVVVSSNNICYFTVVEDTMQGKETHSNAANVEAKLLLLLHEPLARE